MSIHTVMHRGSEPADTQTGRHIHTGNNTCKQAHTEANTDPCIHTETVAGRCTVTQGRIYINTYIQQDSHRQAGRTICIHTGIHTQKETGTHTYNNNNAENTSYKIQTALQNCIHTYRQANRVKLGHQET